MLTFNFTPLFKARGIEKPYAFLTSQGFSPSFSTRIVNNRIKQLNLKDLEKLCNLLHCTPNDFIRWTPASSETNLVNHPLQPLLHTDTILNLTQLLNSVPLQKLPNLENIIRQQINPD